MTSQILFKTTEHNQSKSKNGIAPDRLTVFTFLWACQALVHQEFFSGWLYEAPLLGWILTILVLTTMLFPSSLLLFSAMLASSVLFNVVANWPFVANHILLESIVNVTILGAIATTMVQEYRINSEKDIGIRNHIFDRFAPVVGAMFVLLYYLVFVTKLNWDFINLETSCVTSFYGDVLDRLSFLPLPEDSSAIVASLWIFLIIEIILPVLLTFRKTRYSAFIIGLPFHILLGLIGHRTFSAFVFALYGLICADSITKVLARVSASLGSDRTLRIVWALRFLVISVGFLFAIYYYLTGDYMREMGSIPIHRISYRVWFLWSLVITLLYFSAIARSYISRDSSPTLLWSSRPKLLWLMFAVVFLNGMSPYLGLKTETSFAMYSSLRTEGERTNHFFMPALRLADYQDDLVEILETNHPLLQRRMYTGKDIKRKALITYFELRRIVSETTTDFNVTYNRRGEVHHYSYDNGVNTNPELARKHPVLLAKLLYFRPVFAGEHEYCQH